MKRFWKQKYSSRVPDGYPLPFNIDNELAKSKHSTVFEAIPANMNRLHPSTKPLPVTGEKVVVKLFPLDDPKKSLSACKAEARLLQACDHPLVCKFYGRYSQNGRHFLVMEHFEMDLFAYAFPSPMRGPDISELESLIMFTQVILALEHCHSKGIVHCDVKLENVLVSGGFAALCDFGLAKKFDTNRPRTYGPGTVFYGAPETCLGLKVKGPEIDIWAAGVLLYLLVEGFFPFDGNTSMDIINAIASAGGSPEYSIASPQTRMLISAMLETDPRDRFTIQQIKDMPIIAAIIEDLEKEPIFEDELTLLSKPSDVPIRTNSSTAARKASRQRSAGRVLSSESFEDNSLIHRSEPVMATIPRVERDESELNLGNGDLDCESDSEAIPQRTGSSGITLGKFLSTFGTTTKRTSVAARKKSSSKRVRSSSTKRARSSSSANGRAVR